jgi:hypothetical protein
VPFAEFDAAWSAYLTLARKVFRGANAESECAGAKPLRPQLSRRWLLSRVVEELEAEEEFAHLVNQTMATLGYEPAFLKHPDREPWKRNVQVYFRLSGLYELLLDEGDVNISKWAQKYQEAFNATTDTVIHMAPLELIRFRAEIINCGDFKIRRFSKEELDRMLHNDAKRIFYPWAWIDAAKLCDYFFVYAEETVPACKAGLWLWNDFGNQVFPAIKKGLDPRYPLVIESAVRCLALYDWRMVEQARVDRIRAALDLAFGGQSPDSKEGKRSAELFEAADRFVRPRLPFVITEADSMIQWPLEAPNVSVFERMPGDDPEMAEAPMPGLDLDTSDIEQFEHFMRHIQSLLTALTAFRKQWGFLETSLGFLAKGFGTEGIEQLLWYIVTIEAVLGEDKPGFTNSLRNRISRILGGTANDQKTIRKQFAALYDYRSKLVHGNVTFDEAGMPLGQIVKADEFARGVVLWALHYAKHIADNLPYDSAEVPRRELLLQVLDMDAGVGSELRSLLRVLPADFPNTKDWLKFPW